MADVYQKKKFKQVYDNLEATEVAQKKHLIGILNLTRAETLSLVAQTHKLLDEGAGRQKSARN